MNKSKINYYNDEVNRYDSWNPGGVGCSKRCKYCWAQALTTTPNIASCPKCKNFEVHTHQERISQLARARKPRCVLVNFTCDTFDKERPLKDIDVMLEQCITNPRHVYVFLTKQYRRAYKACHRMGLGVGHPLNWFMGATVTNQRPLNSFMRAEDAAENIDWLSIEPMHSPIQLPQTRFRLGGVQGIIIGHDNHFGAPGTDNIDMVEKLVADAKGLGIKVYVKQLWIDGKLVRDPSGMPKHLQLTELAWTMPPKGS